MCFVAFLLFATGLFAALFVRVAVRTELGDTQDETWWLSVTGSTAFNLILLCAGFLVSGFVFIGIGLILIGQKGVGCAIIAVVGTSGSRIVILANVAWACVDMPERRRRGQPGFSRGYPGEIDIRSRK